MKPCRVRGHPETTQFSRGRGYQKSPRKNTFTYIKYLLREGESKKRTTQFLNVPLQQVARKLKLKFLFNLLSPPSENQLKQYIRRRYKDSDQIRHQGILEISPLTRRKTHFKKTKKYYYHQRDLISSLNDSIIRGISTAQIRFFRRKLNANLAFRKDLQCEPGFWNKANFRGSELS